MLRDLLRGKAAGLRFRGGGEDPSPRAQLVWALIGVLAVLIAGTTLGVLYVRPPGNATYHALAPETGGVRPGDGVRIAGVPVGRVLSVELRGDTVDIEFIVGDGYRIGADTAVDVRMLTPIGGVYLALRPAGDTPLREPIPPERVRLPFLVTDLLPAAGTVAGQVDTEALRAAVDGAGRALAGAPGALRETVAGLGSVVDAMAQQKQQIEDLLVLSNEYLAAVRDNQQLATEVIRAYAILGPQIVAARGKVEIFSDKVTAVVGLLFDFLSGPYAERVEPLLPPLEQTRDTSRQLLADIEAMIAAAATTLTRLSGLAGPEGRALVDQSGLTVMPPPVCIPVPGAGC
ncbi:MlaD family protein [Nocardia carnea]|uniref:MlaD family protein n=1 Tax=Nocardia carnea TaxID=37328 RepID=UPI002458D011|nr:MlaD family protein [Nocardia carnea]